MTASTSIFEADPEGFRSQNADRPAAHLVRELIQNAMDEDGVMNLDVTVTYHGPRKGTTVVVKDDAPAGVTDPKLLFTIWLSNKEDSVTKRGRMGRGLKELVSVCDLTVIKSVGIDAISFERFAGGRWERKTKPRLGRTERGTEVSAFCRAWGEKAAKSIVDFIKRIRPPGSITMRAAYVGPEGLRKCEDVECFNGQWMPRADGIGPQVDMGPCRCCKGTGEIVPFAQVVPFAATEIYPMELPTVLFENVDGSRVERERIKLTTVHCFTPPPGESAMVYEMGIPVEECTSPVSIDVGQRVILRERRDTLTESYKRKLFAKVLSARVDADKVTDDQLRDNAALIAAQASDSLTYSAKKRITKVWTEGKAFASTPQQMRAATGHHIEVVNLRGLPEGIRDIVRSWGTDVKDVMDQRRAEFNPEITALTSEQHRLVKLFEWIAKGVGRECRVVVRQGSITKADFDRTNRVLSLYTEGGCGVRFFAKPLGAEQLGILIHELSHWTPKDDAHGSAFAHDNDTVGGEVASFLFENAAQARVMVTP